jgi:hypothetical protein
MPYHPLFLSNSHGDCLTAKLRPGNVHSVEDWDELLLPEIEREQAECKQVAVRADAALPNPRSTYHWWSAASCLPSAFQPTRAWSGQLPSCCSGLQEASRKLLVRYKSFAYKARSWDEA